MGVRDEFLDVPADGYLDPVADGQSGGPGFTERMAMALAAALGVGVSKITGGQLLTIMDAQRIRGLVSQLDEVLEPGSPPRTHSQSA